MPFTLIKGTFKPGAGQPDGDSVRFRATSNAHWAKLEGKPVNIGTGVETKGTAQLRFEGIDAIEKGATKPLSTMARDSMFDLIGFDASTKPEPAGFILARMTDDQSGRPICFVFAGKTAKKDGSDVFLDEAMLRDSVNFAQAIRGFAYPLYYNTLFASLRRTFNEAVANARKAKRGYWPSDRTTKGVNVSSKGDLATVRPIWPKLWRRMEEFLTTHASLSGFHAFLEQKNERIDILSIMEEQGLQDIVRVNGTNVRLTVDPLDVRVVGEAGQRDR